MHCSNNTSLFLLYMVTSHSDLCYKSEFVSSFIPKLNLLPRFFLPAAFPLLFSLSGCPLADKSLRTLMAAHTAELKYVYAVSSNEPSTHFTTNCFYFNLPNTTVIT